MGLTQDIADALAAHGKAIGLNVPEQAWATKKVVPPGLELEVPDLSFTDLEQAESQLGADDWTFEFLARVWLGWANPTTSQASLVDALERWVAAIKSDPRLGDLVEEAKVTRADRTYRLDPRTLTPDLVGYETTVRVLVLR